MRTIELKGCGLDAHHEMRRLYPTLKEEQQVRELLKDLNIRVNTMSASPVTEKQRRKKAKR